MKDTSFEAYLEDCEEVGKMVKSIREDERKRFINKAYERVAKIEESFTKSIISIESEEITPKFTL